MSVLYERPACTTTDTVRNDVLRGTPGDDVICGRGGHGVIVGYRGRDVLIGGDGRDELFGGDGDDLLDGRAGADQLFVGQAAICCSGDVVATCSSGREVMTSWTEDQVTTCSMADPNADLDSWPLDPRSSCRATVLGGPIRVQLPRRHRRRSSPTSIQALDPSQLSVVDPLELREQTDRGEWASLDVDGAELPSDFGEVLKAETGFADPFHIPSASCFGTRRWIVAT